ncbi:MAG: substrate-binding domain-containing protein [Treponema lecithinolyticum]|jgi:hypothetical protein|uniref:substrate-binding domain-containing protein n=2 Tax=Treponema lecithinolyticum TaxID=53418 RepID=UPI00361A660A
MSLYRLKNKAVFVSGFVLMLLFVFFIFFIQKPPLKNKNHIPRKFGATYMTMDNQYFEVLNSAIEEIVVSNGDILITRDPEQNQQKQNEQILDMLSMGCEFIFINPADWKTVTPALLACSKQKVPFIIVDTDAYQANLALSVILSDNYGAGIQIAKDLIAKRKKAKIVIMYDKVIASTDLRAQGFLDTIKTSNLDYKIVYMLTNTTKLIPSMIEMQNFIETDPDFDVFIGGNDPTMLGAFAAMKKAQPERTTLIYSIDGSPSGKEMIQKGYIEGTVAQFPLKMGKTAAQTAYAYLNGKSIEKRICIPVELITRKNLNRFDVHGWQ